MKKRGKTGFTLVEIMVTIAIIATIAAIAISSMLRNRINANETLAIASCKTVGGACQSYFSSKESYPDSLADLGYPNTNPPYIDDKLAGGEKAGYILTYNLKNPVSFTLNAAPSYPGRTGQRYFYTDETGIVTYSNEGAAGSDDPAVQ